MPAASIVALPAAQPWRWSDCPEADAELATHGQQPASVAVTRRKPAAAARRTVRSNWQRSAPPEAWGDLVRPGQRIALITESARLIATRPWSELDLILRQHGMPTAAYEWEDNDAYAYAMQMIERAPDDDLQELHSYLVGQGDDEPTEAQPWEQGQLRLFMSHLAAKQDFVGQVGRLISFDGVSAFVAHTSIEPSRVWQSVIETALRSCDAMVVFLHEGFHESNWCDQEVGFALARRIPLLVLAVDVMPYGFMSKFQAVKAQSMQPGPLASLVADWLASTPTAQEAMTAGVVTALRRSGSYDRTRRLLVMLQKMPRFTPDQLQSLNDAANDNDQVKNAVLDGVAVPTLIQQLITKHGGTTQPPPTTFLSDDPPF
jgi:TIR domain